jgi:tRNA pseudouridine38-40 synthase
LGSFAAASSLRPCSTGTTRSHIIAHHVRFARDVEFSSWEARDGLLVYKITANSFLYGMVRALVGTMLEVAEGKRELAEFARLLSGGERSEAGPAVQARGLTLVNVWYEDLNFGGML